MNYDRYQISNTAYSAVTDIIEEFNWSYPIIQTYGEVADFVDVKLECNSY